MRPSRTLVRVFTNIKCKRDLKLDCLEQ